MKSQKENILYTFIQSFTGQLLAAKSAKGLCALLIGENKNELRGDLQRRFPKVEVEEIADITPWASMIARFVDEGDGEFGGQLELRGTKFQREVWNALLEIPLGNTLTYAEIARKIGRPKAARAVGAACGANHISLIVPCHRVVGSNGNLTGYYWGTETKRALLRRESERVSGRLLRA